MDKSGCKIDFTATLEGLLSYLSRFKSSLATAK